MKAASNGVIEVVQINAKSLGSNLENFPRTHNGVAALRPRESFGMAFAGR